VRVADGHAVFPLSEDAQKASGDLWEGLAFVVRSGVDFNVQVWRDGEDGIRWACVTWGSLLGVPLVDLPEWRELLLA
jgi:hypothetical protein